MDEYKLALFSKLPIHVDGIPIYSPTIKEIAQVTEKMYNHYLYASTITKENLEDKKVNISNYKVFKDLFLLRDKNNILLFLDALFFWTKLEFKVDVKENEELFFYYDCVLEDNSVIRYELNELNYDTFVNVVKFANCIKKEDAKPKGKVLLEIEEKIRKAKEKINEKLNKKDEDIDLFDLVSVLASNGNGLNAINVVDLNIFTFNDQFQRMKIVEDYDIQIRSLLAGAEIKDIKHYIRKI